jgi:hypothetical protein
MRRALAAAILAGLVVTPAAGSHIIVNKCVAGVSLYDQPAKVAQVLGPPERRVVKTDLTEWRYRGLQVGIYRGARLGRHRVVDVVVYLTTTRRDERTAAGIGVGSSEAALRAAYPRLKCSPRPRECSLGLSPITTFGLKDGRVASIHIDATSAFDDAPFPARDPRC